MVPLHALPERVTAADVDAALAAAAAANMNAVRVWGGGRYEGDGFYARADEMGVMVWQDFIFTCRLITVLVS